MPPSFSLTLHSPGRDDSFHVLLDTILLCLPGRPLGVVHSTSFIVQCLIHSISSLRLDLPCLITKQTSFTFHVSKPSRSTFLNHQTHGSSPDSFLNSVFFFFSFNVHPHIHLIMLISILSNFASCSIFVHKVLLQYIKQLFT